MAQSSQVGLPPANFHLSDFVFRPDFSYSPRPGLQESIERLTGEGRYRSALEPLLAILKESPRDQEALTLALMVVGRSRTAHVQAVEALGPRYLLDRRLDPIFAECSACHRYSWAPHNCLLENVARAQISNAIGVQCRSCGYVLCRNCYQGVTRCPHCGAAALQAPAYPTGRTPRQLERRAKPVAATIVFREGPIPADREWLVDLLELLSPDALEDGGRLSTYPIHPWRSGIEGFAMAVATALIAEGQLGGARLEDPVGAEIQCPDGLRAYVLKLYAGAD